MPAAGQQLGRRRERSGGEPGHDQRGHPVSPGRLRVGQAVPFLRAGVQELEGGVGAAPRAHQLRHGGDVAVPAPVQLPVRDSPRGRRLVHPLGAGREPGGVEVGAKEGLSVGRADVHAGRQRGAQGAASLGATRRLSVE